MVGKKNQRYFNFRKSEQKTAEQRKNDLKIYSDYIFSLLSNFDPQKFCNTYVQTDLKNLGDESNYISSSGNTIKDFNDMLSRLHRCSTSELTANMINKNTGEFKPKTLEKILCGQYSICPVCAHRKRSEVVRSIMPIYKTLLKMKGDASEYKEHEKKIYMYEGTIAFDGSKNPSADYDFLRDSWTRFQKKGDSFKKNGKSYRRSGEAAKIIGSLLSIEIKRENKNAEYWHVHGHLLLVCDTPLEFRIYKEDEAKELYKRYGFGRVPEQLLEEIAIDHKLVKVNGKLVDMFFSKLTEEWFKATQNTGVSFWVRELRPGLNSAGNYTSLEAKLYEILKYVTKVVDLKMLDLFILWDTIKNKKRVTRSGIFGSWKKSQELFENLINIHGLSSDYENLKEQYTIQKNENDDESKENFDNDYQIECTRTYFKKDEKEYTTEKAENINLEMYLSKEYKVFLQERARLTSEYRKKSSELFERYKTKEKILMSEIDGNKIEGIMKPNDFCGLKKQLKDELKYSIRYCKEFLLKKYLQIENRLPKIEKYDEYLQNLIKTE